MSLELERYIATVKLVILVPDYLLQILAYHLPVTFNKLFNFYTCFKVF
jgi:hypothetical protein